MIPFLTQGCGFFCNGVDNSVYLIEYFLLLIRGYRALLFSESDFRFIVAEKLSHII